MSDSIANLELELNTDVSLHMSQVCFLCGKAASLLPRFDTLMDISITNGATDHNRHTHTDNNGHTLIIMDTRVIMDTLMDTRRCQWCTADAPLLHSDEPPPPHRVGLAPLAAVAASTSTTGLSHCYSRNIG
jgi:hypothetical protein